MFHLLAYEEALAAGAASADLDAVPDSEFSQRNSHYIFSEQYNALAMYYAAASATAARLNMPTINAIGRHQLWPVLRSATVPSDPRLQDLRNWPFALPLNEELAVEGSNNLACGTENSTCLLWIAPPTWTRNLPRGLMRVNVGFTAAVAGVAQSWSALGNITFNENLRGGNYAVVGCEIFDAGTLAFRLIFPKAYMYQGRKLRPGALCTEAIGNLPALEIGDTFGEWGRFNTFEPPQLEIYANATGASAQVGRMDLIYLGGGNL